MFPGTKGGYDIRLLHVYNIPAMYTGDGIALTSVYDSLSNEDERLEDERLWVNSNYPGINVELKTTIGGLIATLQDEIATAAPGLIIIGAPGEYGDLWTWDNEILETLTALSVPVLIVPAHISFGSVRNIGFASDYQKICMPQHIRFIKWVTIYTGAQLHILHVSRTPQDNNEQKNKNEQVLHEMLADVNPVYYEIEDPHVIDAIANFVKQHSIDLLIVIPRKHGVWYNITHESHAKQLARLNNMPVLAIPEP